MATVSSQQVIRLYVESDMVAPEMIPVGDHCVVSLCRRCPGKEEPNDDSAAVVSLPSGHTVLVVADGVGGSPAGHKASAIAVESVVNQVIAVTQPSDLRPAILDGIESANQKILELAIGAATTLSVVEVNHRVARAYQVGDSISLIVGQRGAVKWKSTPHSPVGYGIESGMLDEQEAHTHDQRHVVSNYVGSKTMHIEVGPSRPLAARDTIIVGSDGLFDNLRMDEVIELGRRGDPLQRVEQLARLATDRMSGRDPDPSGKPDDLTILLFGPRPK